MDSATDRKPAQPTTVERTSDREVVVTRTFAAPARLVFKAWSEPDLFKEWWVPRSLGMTLEDCEMDVRTGGRYRLTFAGGMDFYGRYVEVVPNRKLVWTNEEDGDAGALTTVTFEESDGVTVLVVRELYPSKDALDAAGTGAQEAMRETFAQLDELLETMAGAGSGDGA